MRTQTTEFSSSLWMLLLLLLVQGLYSTGVQASAIRQCRRNPGNAFGLNSDETCPPIMDDDIAYENQRWAPWTRLPQCLPPKNKQNSKVCLFTDGFFRGFYGLSVIATPENAAVIADVLDDPDLSLHPAKKNLYWGTFQDDDFEHPWEIREVPGKGKGVIATSEIKSGTMIMSGLPAILAAISFPDSVSLAQGRLLLQKSVDQLPDQSRVLSLTRSTGGEEVDDILRSNIFGVSINNERYMALYPELSVSCWPKTLGRLFG